MTYDPFGEQLAHPTTDSDLGPPQPVIARDPLGIGLHDGIPDEWYHSDPCTEPSLSPSIASILCDHSERHAYDAHPKLGGGNGKTPTRQMDHGSLVHAVILGGRSVFEINADDYRSKKAREERDRARAQGEIPVLSKELEPLLVLAEKVQQAWHIPVQHREVTLVWQAPTPEGPVLARCRPDAASIDQEEKLAFLLDLKLTAEATLRRIQSVHVEMGHDVQASANVQAIEVLFPELVGRVEFVDLYVEVSTGYIQPILHRGPMADLGRRRWSRACRAWRRSLTTGVWPAYARHSGQPRVLDCPIYQLQREADAYHEMGFTDG